MARMDGDGGAIDAEPDQWRSRWGWRSSWRWLPDPAAARVGTSWEVQGAELYQGSMTRPSAPAMVGGRCKMVNNMDEMASSLAQRSSCPLPLLSEEVRACSEVEDLLLLAWSLASRRLQGELV